MIFEIVAKSHMEVQYRFFCIWKGICVLKTADNISAH